VGWTTFREAFVLTLKLIGLNVSIGHRAPRKSARDLDCSAVLLEGCSGCSSIPARYETLHNFKPNRAGIPHGDRIASLCVTSSSFFLAQKWMTRIILDKSEPSDRSRQLIISPFLASHEGQRRSKGSLVFSE